jgi:DNA (cytosine-5)-methyltransferase 1
VPQKRIRQLIIGTRRELPIFTALRFMPPTHLAPEELGSAGAPPASSRALAGWTLPRVSGEGAGHHARGGRAPQPLTTLWEAIGDLPPLAAGEGVEEADYDPRRRQSQLARYGGRYLKRVLQIQRARRLTARVARLHSDRDLRDFARLNEGETSPCRRGRRMPTFSAAAPPATAWDRMSDSAH